MATTSPARIDDDLYASAKLVGEMQSRSASQQVVHWARIGREIEASASIAHKDIAEVLAGSRSYDGLSPEDQAIVRAEWSDRMDARREALNLAEQFAAAGRTWVELDDDGNVVQGGVGTEDPRGIVITTPKAGKDTRSVKSGPLAKRSPGTKAGVHEVAKGTKVSKRGTGSRSAG